MNECERERENRERVEDEYVGGGSDGGDDIGDCGDGRDAAVAPGALGARAAGGRYIRATG